MSGILEILQERPGERAIVFALGFAMAGLLIWIIGQTDVEPSVISAGATLILVVVTAAYMLFTKEMVSETRNARQQDVKPILNLELKGWAMGGIGPKLENIGNGPAKDISVDISLTPGGESHTITAENLPPGEFIGSDKPNSAGFQEEGYEKVVATGSFSDIYGKSEDLDQEIDLESYWERKTIHSMMVDDEDERQLKRIESSLSSIADNVDIEGLETYLQLENRKQILNILERDGRITASELQRKTGLGPAKLAGVLLQLVYLDVIETNVPRKEIPTTDGENVEIWKTGNGSADANDPT